MWEDWCGKSNDKYNPITISPLKDRVRKKKVGWKMGSDTQDLRFLSLL